MDILTDLKNIAVCQEWDKQDFNFEKHIFRKSFHTMSFEAILLWEIVKNRANLL
jgi:hypothetical protein